MTTSFAFANPFLALGFAFCFLLLAIWRIIYRKNRKKTEGIGHSSLFFVPAFTGVNPRKILYGLLVFSLFFLLLALARPQKITHYSSSYSEGIDFFLILDTSESMLALDFEAKGNNDNRLDAAKKVIKEFIEKRKGDRMGLVVFGEQTFTQCPLTSDLSLLTKLLEQVEIGMAGPATAIGSALAVGIKRFVSLEAKSKILILLTDGRNNAGEISPLEAAELAKEKGIKIYVIGMGSLSGKAPYWQQGPFGKYKAYTEVDLDEPLLESLAQKTGGSYFRAFDDQSLSAIYDKIDTLEKTKRLEKKYQEYEELFLLPLSLGVFFFVLAYALNLTFLRILS